MEFEHCDDTTASAHLSKIEGADGSAQLRSQGR